MIVVGILAPDSGAESGSSGSGAESVLEIARRAAATGARTEVVGVAPGGPGGDRQLLKLAAASVGHATVTRSAAVGLDAADLDLALRYLPDVRAIALVRPAAPLLATALAASAWSGANLIVVGPLDADATALLDAAGPASDSSSGSAAAASGILGRSEGAAAIASSAGAAARPAGPILLEAPRRDPDGAFAGVVAALAARLDSGQDPASAWQSTVTALALDPA